MEKSHVLSKERRLFIHLVSEVIFSFGNHKTLIVENVENNPSEFGVSKTYFCRETEEKKFSEQNQKLIKDDDIRREVQLKNEPRAHPKSKMSLDERGKEELRRLCEVENFQSMDMKLGSKLRERKKFESRAGNLIRIFD